MSDDLHHECGVAALYWLDEPQSPEGPASRAAGEGDVARLMPYILLDLQNRGQLAAGITSYDPGRAQVLDTFKDVGTVSEVFRMSHPAQCEAILKEYAGKAAIGHTRYATCGLDDARYAQPFERHHGRLWKWFSFAFNGNLANYADLRDRLLAKQHYHFSLNTDTEIIMHALAYRLRGDDPPSLTEVVTDMSADFDGAYDLTFLDAMGRMFVVRDPLGFRPMSWSVQGRLLAAASESAALSNLGFTEIHALEPGQMLIIENGRYRLHRFAPALETAKCFFEWVYFSNVSSKIDGVSVYLARARSGKRLAEMEDQPISDDCVVVPVPDTAKAAADAYAFNLGIPSVEGLIRNRYVGRTFITPNATCGRTVKSKYTPLPEVLQGRRVFLVDDSIVRSTTLRALVNEIRNRGGAKEVHVRIACPPVVAPCFYGIDMTTLHELFAPRFVGEDYDGCPSDEVLAEMSRQLGTDSLRFLTVPDLTKVLGIPSDALCKGCVTGRYPTPWGNRLMDHAKGTATSESGGRRSYE